MKAPKFCPNWADDNHCLQASVRMALGGRMSWDKVNKMTDYEDGLYSWTHVAAIALNQKIIGIKLFSTLDYKQFSERGENYLKEFWANDPRWYADQKVHASLGFKKEQEAAKNLLINKLFIHRAPTRVEIEEMLTDRNFLIALINSRQLAGEEGAAGHFVLLYGQDEDHFILHDPGLPPRKAWRVRKDNFNRAFQNELIVIPTNR